jgi:hypothetical protein
VTVTGAAPRPSNFGAAPSGGAGLIQQGPDGPETCTSNGKCTNLAGTTQDNMNSPYAAISASKVAEAARLHDVAATAGGLSLLDQSVTFSKSVLPQPSSSYTLNGVDVRDLSLGPLSGGTIISGHWFTAADSDADVALVDSGYADSHSLKAGSTVTIDQVRYTVIGIVSQPQEGGNPTDIYVSLARAQAISLRSGSSMRNDVNTIYLTAVSAADISTVSKEISGLLPGTTVTTASSLASEVTGSVG